MNRPSLALRSALVLQRAQGKPGADRTHGPRAMGRKHGGRTTGVTGAIRLSLRDGLRLIRALPGETWLCCHRLHNAHLRNRKRHLPLGRQACTTSPSALRALVRPRAASTASRPAFVTTAKRPSIGRDGRTYTLSYTSDKAKYFCRGGLTHFVELPDVSNLQQHRRNQLRGIPSSFRGARSASPESIHPRYMRPDGFRALASRAPE
ncbi:hypothetical protein ACVMB0_003724 [Bradyrhizobium sp. USDA 4451]